MTETYYDDRTSRLEATRNFATLTVDTAITDEAGQVLGMAIIGLPAVWDAWALDEEGICFCSVKASDFVEGCRDLTFWLFARANEYRNSGRVGR